jgi:hypothetical protein
VPLCLLLERTRGLRPDLAEPAELVGWELRGPVTLHARWDPSGL